MWKKLWFKPLTNSIINETDFSVQRDLSLNSIVQPFKQLQNMINGQQRLDTTNRVTYKGENY